MADPTAPDDEVIAQAWHMAAKERLSTREIARKLDVAHSTAVKYVKRGREAEGWIELLDRADLRTDMTARAHALAAWLDEVKGSAATLPERVTFITTALAIEKHLRAMHGLDAPTRYAIGRDAPTPVAPDAGLIAAVRRLRDLDAEDTRELNAGRPGILERTSAPRDT